MRQVFKVVMTAVLVVLLSLGSVARGFAQGGAGRPFITKWQGKAGEKLKLPIVGRNYKLVIKNEKGEVVKSEEMITVTGEDDSFYHAFTPKADGVYTVEAGPAGVRYIRMRAEWQYGKGDIFLTSNDNLLEVVQFGTVAWVSMKQMFYKCEKMTFAAGIDTPDLTNVTDMSEMFARCSSFNQPLEKWDVSNVTNMSEMFSSCSAFNQPLNWDVSQVSSMKKIFYCCISFNQPLNWDVSRVTDMSRMFAACSSFNQPLEKWNVSQVTDMSGMFAQCSSFNQPLEKWNVSKVTDMSGMFAQCSPFNQPLEKWNVSKVTDMSSMFAGCSAFNQPLEKWDVSQVTDMSYMFAVCSSFNQPLEKWDVSQVTRMGGMFHRCLSFNQPLEKWNVSKVTNMSGMFEDCFTFNQPLGSWKIKTAIGSLGRTAMSPSNYSATLVGWAAQTEIAENVHFSDYINVLGLIYNNEGKTAREKLIAKGWSFQSDEYRGSGVAITPSTLWLALNEEITLSLEKWGVEKTEQVTLSCDKEEIISYTRIADGKGIRIKALKNGACWLTATIAAKEGVHKEYLSLCQIRVYAPRYLTVTPSCKTLKIGESFTLKTHIYPEDITTKASYYSDNDHIATVDKKTGEVTAKAVGKCTITAISEIMGSDARGTCEITVVEEIAPIASISIAPANNTLKIGECVTLQSKVVPDNAEQGLIWSSSDPSIAKVSGGVVYGSEAGNCTITARSMDTKSKVVATCKIAVVKPVKSISIIPDTKTLKVSESITLVAKVVPENAREKGVIWSSSDSEIASVDQMGKITAHKVGKCTITAKTKEERSTVAGMCDVIVLKPVESISVTPSSKTLKVGESVTLTATVAPENASENGVTWSSADTNIATIDATGKVTAKNVGTCTITAQTKEDGSSVKGTCTITVVENNGGGNGGGSLQPQTPQAVEDAVLASLSVMPNPFSSQLRIDNPEGIAARYELVNASGVVVRFGAFSATEVLVDTEALPAGVYFVRLEAQNGAKKVVKVIRH